MPRYADLKLAPARVSRTDCPDGSFILASPVPLSPYASNICEFLHLWAEAAPERPFIAQRDETSGASPSWRSLTYAQTLQQVRSVAASLLARIEPYGAPVMLLSDNSIEHGILQLACMYVGIPVAPVSPAYSLLSQDHERLKHIAALLKPRIIFAGDGTAFGRALSSLDLSEIEVVVCERPPAGLVATDFGSLLDATATADVDKAFAEVSPDTLAKILFTSGSTGLPKGVCNTQRMLCSNQEAILQTWPFLGERPPILLDWLPWNHTFGGNHNIGLVLRNGGTLYIDGGKPTPDRIGQTVANLERVSPTIYFNVPRGYAMLLPYLEADSKLRDKFFAELGLIFYSGAALPHDLWTRLERLSIAARGEIVPITSAWGATETAPAATSAHFPIEQPGNIGLPIPGTEVKFVPDGDKLEMRLRGPQVTPGYYRQENLNVAAFDAEGFYRIGDAGKLADPERPEKGIVFDGRVAEDFKLLSGVWVSAGQVRMAAIDATAPLIQDAVVAGHDRDEIGLLVFLNPVACAQSVGLPSATTMPELILDVDVRASIRERISDYNAAHTTSSQRIARVMLLADPPSIDANEITDKGYVNQRAVLERRADLVEVLFHDDPAVLLF
ncbi:MAG: feruloyl-CoA synthase [Hyphomicrobiaceae bacterium]